MDNIRSVGKDIHIFACVISVIAASIIVNLAIKSGYNLDAFIIGRDNYEMIDSAVLSEVIFVTVYTRLRQLAVVYILFRLINPEITYNAVIAVFSFIAGGMVCIQTFYEGFYGVAGFLLFLFPHYIFYFFVLRTLYLQIRRSGKVNMRFFMIVFLLLASGVISELLFSKIFLNEFYQYIVSV
jgi:hypothetical protein